MTYWVSGVLNRIKVPLLCRPRIAHFLRRAQQILALESSARFRKPIRGLLTAYFLHVYHCLVCVCWASRVSLRT